MSIFITQPTIGQKELTHYYLEINGTDSHNFEYKIGVITYNEYFKPKKTILKDLTTFDHLVEKINSSLRKENTSDILNIFIHGIWSNKNSVWKRVVQNISKDIYTTGDQKEKVILSIIWDSSINYIKGVKIARRKGRYLAPFLTNILATKNQEIKINFLCHSMGNRIFQHMIVESELLKNKKHIIDQYIAVGGDLQHDIFEKDEPLFGIDKVVSEITIFVHNNDRSLKMSKND
ncbi:MAG: alpha/beta hydrolase [Saprospiraceae bacterium]